MTTKKLGLAALITSLSTGCATWGSEAVDVADDFGLSHTRIRISRTYSDDSAWVYWSQVCKELFFPESNEPLVYIVDGYYDHYGYDWFIGPACGVNGRAYVCCIAEEQAPCHVLRFVQY